MLNPERQRSLLDPLLEGKIVKLTLEVGSPGAAPKIAIKRKVIVIVPGVLLGSPRDTALVSIIRSGATPITMDRHKSVANLVFAGMPAKFARELVGEFIRVIKES